MGFNNIFALKNYCVRLVLVSLRNCNNTNTYLALLCEKELSIRNLIIFSLKK